MTCLRIIFGIIQLQLLVQSAKAADCPLVKCESNLVSETFDNGTTCVVHCVESENACKSFQESGSCAKDSSRLFCMRFGSNGNCQCNCQQLNCPMAKCNAGNVTALLQNGKTCKLAGCYGEQKLDLLCDQVNIKTICSSQMKCCTTGCIQGSGLGYVFQSNCTRLIEADC